VAEMPGSGDTKQAEPASQLGRDAWALFGRWAAVALALLHSDGTGLLWAVNRVVDQEIFGHEIDEGPVDDKCHA
jgi:hypothetical protein